MKPLRSTVLSGRLGGPKFWTVAVALVLVAGVAYLLHDRGVPAAAAVAVVALQPGHGAAGGSPVAGAAGVAEPRGADLAAAAGLAPVPAEPGDNHTFEVDAAGKLVRNEQVRLHVEALVALTPPGQLHEVALAQVQDLPAAAAVEALDLIERYNGYQAAQKLAFAPGNAPLVPEEALAELDGLHALRVSYFGREGAQSLFGKEEAAARQLLEWMRQDNAPGLSMEQRAMRAQAKYDALQASQAGASAPR
jgi:hypothetical protein